MSQRNIDVFHRATAAINAREVPRDLLGPEFRIEGVGTTVTERTYHGVAGWREWMSDLYEVFADGARYEIEEIIADGDGFVVALVRVVGRGESAARPTRHRPRPSALPHVPYLLSDLPALSTTLRRKSYWV
jgi:hypothetical protein